MGKLFKRNVSLILTAILVFAIFSTALPVQAAESKNVPNIYLRGTTINPQEMKLSSTEITRAYSKGETGPYIVSFNGPICDFMKKEIESKGAKIVEYVPDFSFLVMMTPENAQKVSKLSCVSNVMVYEPLFKIDPEFMNGFGNIKNFKDMKVRIINFNNTIREDLIDSNEIMNFANLNSVKFIEPVPEFQLFNDVARGYMGVEGISNLGYTGEGQVVGIADTGLDSGRNDSSMHKDFQGKIEKLIPLGRSTADDPNGHGTHVAGSVLGNGASSNGKIKGIAPDAHLVFQSVLDSRDGLGGLPNNLNDLFSQAWNSGARIHTNSWGAAVSGVYNTSSREVDEFVWNNNDMIILFAAGNEGQGLFGGSTKYNSIGSPGTAKNCITVGASENYRPEKGAHADNPKDIAAFSSRGTCKDGRVKPDIVAPGTWILSTKSSKAPTKNFWGEYNDHYAYMGGTSMATPLTAGAVAVAREYMIKEWKHTPSSAMMKAAIINGATDLGYGPASRDQGWGRINLEDSLKLKQYKYEDQTKKLSTGQTANYVYAVKSKDIPLKVSLVWTDYPGSTSASKALVNDLDLKITSPSGKVYYGNDFSKSNKEDRLNNVENVFIDNPEVGNYQIEVIAYNVPQGPQSFALFASGDFGEVVADKEKPICNITAPANNATVNGKVTINADAKDNVGVTKVEFYVDGANIGTVNKTPYTIDWDTTKVTNGSHILQAKAYDAAGNIGESNKITVNVNNKTEEPEEPEEPEDPVVPGTEYVTETYSGSASWWSDYEKVINVTAPGKITAEANSSYISMKLYDESGNKVAEGTNSISYNAPIAGKYTIRVSSSSFWGSSFSLKVTYPVAKGDNDNPEEPIDPEEPGTEYVTETYSGSASWWSDYKKVINVTATGKITIELDSSSSIYYGSALSVKLYDKSGNMVAKGTGSVSYDAKETGKYTIVVSSDWLDSFTLKVTYPKAK